MYAKNIINRCNNRKCLSVCACVWWVWWALSLRVYVSILYVWVCLVTLMIRSVVFLGRFVARSFVEQKYLGQLLSIQPQIALMNINNQPPSFRCTHFKAEGVLRLHISCCCCCRRRYLYCFGCCWWRCCCRYCSNSLLVSYLQGRERVWLSVRMCLTAGLLLSMTMIVHECKWVHVSLQTWLCMSVEFFLYDV